MKRLLKPVIAILAALYFLADAVFLTLAKPLADWLGDHTAFERLRRWIRSLPPYGALALFAVPVLLLEPVKPAAAYLAATGHWRAALAVLAVGEILKLVLVERLFSISRNQLMSIPAFAWGYGKYHLAKAWLQSTETWRTVRRWSRMARLGIRLRLARLRAGSALPMAR
jgi:apolipoprotein N-acyltransferase